MGRQGCRDIFLIVSCYILKMKRLKLGLLLIVMMFGHNFVLNQTQSMQKPLQEIHDIGVTEFNLLYSIPSAISIFFIIPMGFFYNRIASKLLWGGAIFLSLGQLMVAIFGGEGKTMFFQLLMTGRIFQGIGAEILYMIQGNMASSWMGKYAGIVFILPELGQIANVFVTPWTFEEFGISTSFLVGFFTCLVSSLACIAIYFGLKNSLAFSKEVKQEEIKSSQSISVQVGIEMTGQGVKVNPLSKAEDSRESEQVEEEQVEPNSIFQAGKVTWLVLILCGINECLYFPFLDNANQLVTNRFCIPYEQTGFYLSIPFLAAMITSAVSSYIIPRVQRHRLIFYVSLLPLLGHSLIFFDFNCDQEPTLIVKIVLALGLTFFGIGIGTYYSVSFPAVGLSVPSCIRGMAYACMAFFQTIAMTIIPILAGLIIQSEERITKLSEGYRQESLLFVVICLLGVLVSFLISTVGKEDSFMFNDEEELSGEGKELLKSSTGTTRSHSTQ